MGDRPAAPPILDDAVTRTVYSTDNSVYQIEPAGVVLPETVEQVAIVLRENAAGARRPVVARGGGTGTNGQSLTDGIVVDVKRELNRIVEIDPVARTAIVEPGLVTAELNAALAPHGLFWAPHTSTLNRATVGGMISTDAAGKGSMIHGRTHRHVRRLDVLLADGTSWTAEPVSIEEAECRAAGTGAGAALWRRLLDLPVDDASAFDLPELARGFSGYGIDRLRRDGMIDPVALLCGAEGTLAVIVRATLSLEPLPESVALVVAAYPDFGSALDDAVRLRETGPTAIETFDETTLARGRSSPAWSALGRIVGDHDGAILLLEYAGEAFDHSAVAAEIETGERCAAVAAVLDRNEQASIWKVRADAVGLLARVAVGGPERSARPTAFVEDCAVPVAEMPAFIAGFRELLDDAGLTYGMFGHADVGCVHVRPALDLTDADDRALHASITVRVTDLVRRHGGILWGEHGRGFRGGDIADVLDEPTLELMRRVKSAFDPEDLLNPGKLYRPLGSELSVTAVSEPPLRGERDEAVAVGLRRSYGGAFACNGNGLCHHYDAAEVMCPSYKATGDPALSPRGRADLIRAWLGERRGDADFEAALVDNLSQCLSCSACTGHCPVEVDIPELKSRVLAEIGGRRRGHRVMGWFEQAARLAAVAPGLARPFLGIAERITGLVDLPLPTERRRGHRRFRPSRRVDVVVLPDVFTSALEPQTLDRTMRLLESMELVAVVAPFVPSGKFEHVKGHRGRFRRIVGRQLIELRRVLWVKSTPLVIEPAVALLHRHEYPAVVDDYPADGVVTLPELLLEHVDRLPSVGEGRAVTLLGHCTERATSPAQLDAWCTVLSAAGYTVETPAVGCCGMAGIFGHEPANQEMSHRLWELSWQAPASAAGLVAATGYSCRSQGRRHETRLLHPVELLIGG